MCEVEVFGAWFSTHAKKVEMALDFKGVKYEYIEEDLKNKSSLLVHHNPINKKVPILVHNGKTIVESMVILEYIDETWNDPPILPKEPLDRARSRFWAKFVQEKCSTPSWKACWSAGEEREKMKKEAEEGLKILENEIEGKKFFGGEKVGLVDFASIFIAFWLQIIQQEAELEILTQEKFPNLWKWAHEFCDNSFVKKHLPNMEKMAAEFKIGLANGRLY